MLFTQQRKALELSIAKSKKLEEDNHLLVQRNRNLEEQHKAFFARIEQLEQDRDMLIAKHKKDKDLLEGELDREREDRRKVLRQLES